MTGFLQVSLKELLEQLGEDRVISILSGFSCPLNKDVENFLKRNAILFTKQGLSATHLIFTSFKSNLSLIGYFTLATKFFTISKGSLSKTLQKRVNKFTTYLPDTKRYYISAPLIAQLGKNYSDGLNNLISGDELLKLACDKVATIQHEIGGKIVYLECEDKPKLIEFYSSNGFVNFGKRLLEKDESDVMDGIYLIQMMKYF